MPDNRSGNSVIFQVDIQDVEAQAAVGSILRRLENRLPFFKVVGEILTASTKQRIEDEQGPDGQRWPELSPATLLQRSRNGRSKVSMLRETGLLMGSIHSEASETGVKVGAVPPYSAIHQFGGKINIPGHERVLHFRKADKGLGRRFAKASKAEQSVTVSIPARTVTIPARPYLGLSNQDETEILNAAEDWLTR